MKRFTGQSKQSNLSGLANTATEGDLSILAEMINKSLKQVSDDLQPVSEDQETVNNAKFQTSTLFRPELFSPNYNESTHIKLLDLTACLTGYYEISHHYFMSPYVRSIMPVSVKEKCRYHGNKQTLCRCQK